MIQQKQQLIPESLLTALHAYLNDPKFLPPQGSPGLRAMVKIGGEPLPSDFEWIDRQQQLIEEADKVLKALHQADPMPTLQELVDGAAEYPSWVGKGWAETLILPWSQDLDNAIREAKLYVLAASSET